MKKWDKTKTLIDMKIRGGIARTIFNFIERDVQHQISIKARLGVAEKVSEVESNIADGITRDAKKY